MKILKSLKIENAVVPMRNTQRKALISWRMQELMSLQALNFMEVCGLEFWDRSYEDGELKDGRFGIDSDR